MDQTLVSLFRLKHSLPGLTPSGRLPGLTISQNIIYVIWIDQWIYFLCIGFLKVKLGFYCLLTGIHFTALGKKEIQRNLSKINWLFDSVAVQLCNNVSASNVAPETLITSCPALIYSFIKPTRRVFIWRQWTLFLF